MRYLIILVFAIVSVSVHSAAMVYGNTTEVEMSGVVGEDNILAPLKYHLTAELKDGSSYWPHNRNELGKLSAKVGGVELEISKEDFSGLTQVDLKEIHFSYIKQFKSESSIEIYIPFGESKLCKDHDEGSTSIRKNVKVLRFNSKGNFLSSKVNFSCTH